LCAIAASLLAISIILSIVLATWESGEPALVIPATLGTLPEIRS
jgi:hypothetical protein